MMESTLAVFVIALTGFCLCDKVAELEIRPPGVLKQGDNVTIVCRVTGMSPWDFFKIVRVIDGKEWEITTNDILTKVFTDSGRYRTNRYELTDGTAEVELYIDDIQGTDGGRVGCRDPSSDAGNGAYEDITVYVPPKMVHLQYKDKDGEVHLVEDGGELQLQDGWDTAILCMVHVEGTKNDPQVDVMLDDRSITDRFVDVPAQDHDSKTPNGLLHMSTSKTLEYSTDEPELGDNGKTVKCQATLEHFPPVSASATLSVLYGPELECDSQLFAKVGTQNVQIVCKSNMNPPSSEFTWKWGKKGNKTTIMEGETSGPFTASKQDMGNDMYEFILNIDEVTEEHFRNYKIFTSNSIDEAEMTISLQKEEVITTRVPTTPIPIPTEKLAEVDLEIDGDGNDGNHNPASGSSSVQLMLLHLAVILCSALLLTRT